MEKISHGFTLNHPMTKEDWDKIIDADMDNIPSVTFTTKHGKEVEYMKVVRCRDCKYWDRENRLGKRCECYKLSKFTFTPHDWYCADGERRAGDD